jgi:STIMATE family
MRVVDEMDRTQRIRRTKMAAPHQRSMFSLDRSAMSASLVVALACCASLALAEDNNSNSNSNYAAQYYNGSDSGICKVYDGSDIFTILIQAFLALAAMASLYIKRLRGHPRRTLSTWFLDVSKQGFGAAYAHVLNMLIAGSIVNNVRGSSSENGSSSSTATTLQDECAWYGMSYLLDTTLGLLLAVIGLQWLERTAKARRWTALEHSGVYSGDTALSHWTAQVTAWIVILTIVKILIYAFIWVCSAPLASIGSLLFAPFTGYKHLELLFVMILFPGILNVVYFWIADSYLQAASDQTAAHEHDESTLEDKKEALLSPETQLVSGRPAPPPSWSSLASNGLVQPSTTTASV